MRNEASNVRGTLLGAKTEIQTAQLKESEWKTEKERERERKRRNKREREAKRKREMC